MKGLSLLLLVVVFASCRLTTPPKITQDSGYVLFELDSKARTTALAWMHRVTIDSGSSFLGLRPHPTELNFVEWPVAITDSLKHVLKTKDGKSDSTRKQWVTLSKEFILQVYPCPTHDK